jgi:transketolase
MVGTASGLAAAGKIPFAASFGCFASRRVYDQFFLSANYARLNVNLVGSDPGVTALYNGGTHMTFEDAGIMRNIPGLRSGALRRDITAPTFASNRRLADEHLHASSS